MEIIPDPWQNKVLRRKGNLVLLCGRQCGKSEIISIKLKELSKTHPTAIVVVTASAERQALLLFEKILAKFKVSDIKRLSKRMIGKEFRTKKAKREFEKEFSDFDEPPTMKRLKLKCGFEVICLPTGRTGAYIRGYTCDVIVVDEAHNVYEEVWSAITPMLAVSEKMKGLGFQWLMGTAGRKKQGYFFDSIRDKNFLYVHFSSEKCKRISKKFLKKEKERMTKAEYGREYLAKYTEDFNKYFSTKLIKKCFKIEKYNFEKEYNKGKFNYYLGVDVARYGRDDCVFYIVESNKQTKFLRGIYMLRMRKIAVTTTVGNCIALDRKFNFRKMYIDEGGVGGGVMDMLIEKFRRKVIGMDNNRKSISQNMERKTVKEDMYSNLLVLMEQGKCEFLKDRGCMFSMDMITYDYDSKGRMMISGKQDHICEAMVRAFWGKQDQKKRLFLY